MVSAEIPQSFVILVESSNTIFVVALKSRLGEARPLGFCRKTCHHLSECLAANCRSCGRRLYSLLHFLKFQTLAASLWLLRPRQSQSIAPRK